MRPFKRLLIIGGLFAALVIGVGIFQHIKPQAKVFMALPLSGTKSKKGQLMYEATQLFAQKNSRLQFEIADSRSETLRAAYLVAEALDLASYRYIFLPAGTEPSLLFINKFLSPNNVSRAKKRDLWNLIAAGENINQAAGAHGVFFRASDYLRGIVPKVKQKSAEPGHIFIVLQDEVSYFNEIAAHLQNEIIAEGWQGKIKNIKLSSEWQKDLQLLADQVRAQDWVVFIFYRAQTILDALPTKKTLLAAQKIFIYGDEQLKASAVPNVWQAVFWSPYLSYHTQGEDNCEFVKEFRSLTGQTPDFHAAYLYATLQVIEQMERKKEPYYSVTGPVVFDEMGNRKIEGPIVLHTDAQLHQREYLPKAVARRCDESH